MKLKIQNNQLEIETKDLPIYCLICEKHLGDIDYYIEKDHPLSSKLFTDTYVLCRSCFDAYVTDKGKKRYYEPHRYGMKDK